MKTSNFTHSFFGFLFLLFAGLSGAAQNGEIIGTVLDENKESMPGAIVTLLSGDQELKKVNTDGDGKYTFKPLDAGDYTLRVASVGYKILQTTITVSSGKTSFRKFSMIISTTVLGDVKILPKEESMVQETMSSGKKIDYLVIKNMPVQKGDIVALACGVTPGVMPTDDGKDMYIRGSRRGTTAYFIDDQRVIGSFDVPALSIGGMTVYTGGVPAMYGDVTGGIVLITTKSYFSGMSQKKAMVEDIYKNKKKEVKGETEEEEELIID